MQSLPFEALQSKVSGTFYNYEQADCLWVGRLAGKKCLRETCFSLELARSASAAAESANYVRKNSLRPGLNILHTFPNPNKDYYDTSKNSTELPGPGRNHSKHLSHHLATYYCLERISFALTSLIWVRIRLPVVVYMSLEKKGLSFARMNHNGRQ